MVITTKEFLRFKVVMAESPFLRRVNASEAS